MTEDQIHELLHDSSCDEEPQINHDMNIRFMPSIHTITKQLVGEMQKKVMRADL